MAVRLSALRTRRTLLPRNIIILIETLTDASKEVALEINLENTKCVLLSSSQNARRNHDIKIANTFFENMIQLKYFGAKSTNQNLIQPEIKRRRISGGTCYHSVQKLLSTRLLLKSVKVRICKIIILPVVLYGRDTWSRTLRVVQELGVF
jgi:hypothetical protein